MNNTIFYSGRVIDKLTLLEEIAAFDRLYTAGSKTGMFFFKSKASHDTIRVSEKTEAPKLLDSRYMLLPEVLLFKQGHCMYEVFDKKIQQLLEAHLIDYYIEKYNEEVNLKRLEKHDPPFKVLTLGELEAGFVISTAPLVLSIVAFCLEWLVTLKNLLVVLVTLKTYFMMKKHEQDQQIELNKIKMAAWELILSKKELSKNVSSKKVSTQIASGVLSN